MGLNLDFVLEGLLPDPHRDDLPVKLPVGSAEWVGIVHSMVFPNHLGTERSYPFYAALGAWSSRGDCCDVTVGALYEKFGDEESLYQRADLSQLGRAFTGKHSMGGTVGIVPLSSFCEEWYACRNLPEPKDPAAHLFGADLFDPIIPFIKYRIVFNIH